MNKTNVKGRMNLEIQYGYILNVEWRDLGSLHRDRRMIIDCVLEKQSVKVWFGFHWSNGEFYMNTVTKLGAP
jgi:hypothetical protein